MPDHTAIQLALRARLLTLSVCTTGSATIAQTTSGYTRTVGSFLADGFAPGMEVLPTGMSDTRYGVIDTVSALSMNIIGGRTAADPAASGRTLTVGLPELTAWDNVQLTPQGGKPYLEEEYVPATSSLVGMPYTGGTMEDTGLYLLRWYSQTGVGLRALSDPANAILTLFKAGTIVTVSSAVALQVRGDFGPTRSAMRPDLPGTSVITVTIPWRVYSLN